MSMQFPVLSSECSNFNKKNVQLFGKNRVKSIHKTENRSFCKNFLRNISSVIDDKLPAM